MKGIKYYYNFFFFWLEGRRWGREPIPQNFIQNKSIIQQTKSACYYKLYGILNNVYGLLLSLCYHFVYYAYRYATPFGLTSEYAHPAEILFLGFATIIGPAVTGPHLITLWLWMVLRVLETVEAHCGYHFPWSLSNFLPLYGGLVYAFSSPLPPPPP